MPASPRRIVALCAGIAVALSTLAGPAQTAAPDPASKARQSGVTSLTAPVVQPGGRPASSSKARLAGSVQLTPARPGRPVVIQRQVAGGPWKRVARKPQNKAGAVHFTGPASAGREPFVYRGVAARWQGLGKQAARPQSAAVWAAAFTDEFKGRKLGPQWADRRTESSSRKCSKVGDRRASVVRRGTLRLRVMVNPHRRGDTCRIRRGPDQGSYRYYLNGQVSTQDVPHAFTFGTFAARMKFPRTRGKHGAFWMQPLHRRDLQGRPGKSGAEIDIAEFFGQGYPQGGFASFLYNYGINAGSTKIGGMAPRATRMLPRGDAWWKSYHVFSLEWTKRAYIFRVDGREDWRTRRGVSRIDEYLILSLLSSDWELRQAKKLGIQPKGTMHVDWTRVWQK